MTYRLLDNYLGYPPIEIGPIAAPATLNLLTMQWGTMMAAVDKVYGGGEFIFARANGSIRQFGLCTILPVWDSVNKIYTYNAAEVANTANLAQTLAVSQAVLTVGQYGWFQVQGVTPISAAASVAAGASFGIGGAGQIGAVAAGKQVLNAVSVAPATQTVVKAGTGLNGDTVINVPDTDGLFLGMALTGTGVGAGVIATIDPMGRYIISTVANSAAVAGNVTATMTGFIVAAINRPFAQGAIT
jgi:hypothetical protein